MTSRICWAAAVPAATGGQCADGVSHVAGSAVTILHAKGANLTEDPALRATLRAFGAEIPVDGRSPRELVAEAVAVAARADVVVAVLSEPAIRFADQTVRTRFGATAL